MGLTFRFIQIILVLATMLASAQQDSASPFRYIGVDFSFGILGDSNTDFPNHSLQKSLFLNFGKRHSGIEKAWVHFLNKPKVGLLVGFSDLGNKEALGHAYSLLPYFEFSLLPAKTDRLHLSVGFGGSYVNRIYNKENNLNNKGVSTRLNWSYRSYFYYDFFKGKSILWRAGLGYLHHSNGHTRKPNRGYNSFLLGVSAEFFRSTSLKSPTVKLTYDAPKKRDWFYTGRFGIGQNSFSDVFNAKKEVFTTAISAGRVINKTFMFGGGVYYHFYEHYYDYIVNEETLIKTQEPQFRKYPIVNASNLGVFASAELLLGHVGVEFDLGINFFKPFYKIDWQLNEGYTTFTNGEENIVLGDLDVYYQIKRYVFSRMGLKYYVFNTERSPRHNIFLGAFINANLGQADFSEFTIGYQHRFKF